MTPTEATTLERGARLRWPDFGLVTRERGQSIPPRCAQVDTGAAVIAVPIERLERVQ